MLSFTEQLKELIHDVETRGGSTVQKISPPSELMLKLKGYVIKRLREQPEQLSRNVEFFLLEEFNEGFFEEGIRVCLVHLGEMGITDPEEVSRILHKVIDRRLEMILGKGDERHLSSHHPDKISIDDALVQSVEYVWEEYGSEPTILYNFAKQRFLIAWDYQGNRWQTTGLGRFLLELKPLQVISLLLTIDLTFNTCDRDIRHMSAQALKSLLEFDKREHFDRIVPLHKETLKRLGVLRSLSRHWEYELTPLGKVVVNAVLSEDNPMREVVKALVENEEQGIHFEGSDKELDLLRKQLASEAMDQGSLTSIGNAIALYTRESYTDAARIFFPSIEAVANQMLLAAGENLNDHKVFPGMARKLSRLEELKLIPSDLSKAIDIVTSRNKVLHGEYEPLEQEYAYPLCVAGIIYLRRMLNEFEKAKAKVGNNRHGA
jgi:hypothetical protein